MPTSKVNRNTFIQLSVSAKITYSRDRVADMTGNANFPTPSPTLATITSVTDDLETKQLAAEGGGPAQTVARDAAEKIWNTTLRAEADYVDSIALGDVVKITSAGFTPTDTERTPHGAPAKPEKQKFIHTQESAAVIFTCDAVPNADGYVAVLSSNPDFPITSTGTTLIISTAGATPAPFAAPPPAPTPSASAMVAIDASKDRKKTIRGLISGTRMYARMYAFNAAGRGVDSDVISIIVG